MEASIVPTPIGPVAVVRSPQGLTRLLLPPFSERTLRTVTRGAAHVDPSAEGFRGLAERLRAHLSGRSDPLTDVPVDLAGSTDFARRVYAAARAIPPGRTSTYGGLAQVLGEPPGASRAIGTALGRNPIPLVVPCHRVVGAANVGGFSAPGGLSTKALLLAVEGGSLDTPDHAVSRRHLARVDPDLAPLVRRVPCTLPLPDAGLCDAPDAGARLFRTLVRAIAGQQLSTQAARTIFGRIEASFAAAGDPFAPAPLLARGVEPLRALGLSTAKVASVRDLAARVLDGRIDLGAVSRWPDDAIVGALTEVRGIGVWTVEMLLVFELGRLDVLPIHDLGIRKGLARVRGLRRLPEPDDVVRHAERWRPFRSVGSYYLWRALEADASLFRGSGQGSPFA